MELKEELLYKLVSNFYFPTVQIADAHLSAVSTVVPVPAGYRLISSFKIRFYNVLFGQCLNSSSVLL
jgi:hypothetical protein